MVFLHRYNNFVSALAHAVEAPSLRTVIDGFCGFILSEVVHHVTQSRQKAQPCMRQLLVERLCVGLRIRRLVFRAGDNLHRERIAVVVHLRIEQRGNRRHLVLGVGFQGLRRAQHFNREFAEQSFGDWLRREELLQH